MTIELVSIVGGLIVVTYFLALPTKHRVIRLLRKHSIDYHSWGENPKENTLDHLVEFLQNGESWLEDHTDNIIVHHVNVAVIWVKCRHNNQDLELREYRNGAPRGFSGSLGEKIKDGEQPIGAARRGLFEELGPTEPRFRDDLAYDLDANGHEVTKPCASDFFPGLFDSYHRDYFICTIPKDMYHNRYIAEDNGRQIYFCWVNPKT